MDTILKVPFNNLHAQYLSIKDEVDEAISRVINDSSFIRGENVDRFEQEFSKIFNVNNCISCANGTDAIYIALKALKVKPGDEVIVPANSWISTSETVSQAGAKIIFCDIDKDTFTIDPDLIDSKITSKTVGIIPVHLYGHPAEMDKIMKLANKNKLWVIEDCAQAHLAKYDNQFVGLFGDFATFSFYPGKNLGAMGDAGAVVTNDNQLARNARLYANHGSLKKHHHEIEGINSRMDGLQAAVLRIKLRHIKDWTIKRQKIANTYSEKLNNIKMQIPLVAINREHVWHLYVIKTKKREKLMSYLNNLGIQTGIHYPTPLPFLQAYSKFGHKFEDFPNAYENQSKILSLPIYPELNSEQLVYVANSINRFFETC